MPSGQAETGENPKVQGCLRGLAGFRVERAALEGQGLVVEDFFYTLNPKPQTQSFRRMWAAMDSAFQHPTWMRVQMLLRMLRFVCLACDSRILGQVLEA